MVENLNTNHLSESDIESKTTSTNYSSFLKGSKRKIVELMQDAQFRTLKQIEDATDIIPTTSSALLRQLRTDKQGSHTVNLKNTEFGYQYQLVLNVDK